MGFAKIFESTLRCNEDDFWCPIWPVSSLALSDASDLTPNLMQAENSGFKILNVNLAKRLWDWVQKQHNSDLSSSFSPRLRASPSPSQTTVKIDKRPMHSPVPVDPSF